MSLPLGRPAAVEKLRSASKPLVAKRGRTVRMARSLDRPLRYFLAKRQEGPALVAADRIDAIHAWLAADWPGCSADTPARPSL